MRQEPSTPGSGCRSAPWSQVMNARPVSAVVRPPISTMPCTFSWETRTGRAPERGSHQRPPPSSARSIPSQAEGGEAEGEIGGAVDGAGPDGLVEGGEEKADDGGAQAAQRGLDLGPGAEGVPEGQRADDEEPGG